ncbi:MAG: ABC transporter substrate-binding protein, partial [Candidatus Bathyarchaeia archaeon]
MTQTQAIVIIVIILVAAVGIWYAMRPSPAPTPAPPPTPPPEEVPQVLTFATSEDIDNLDPHFTVKNCEMRLTYLIYDGLLQYGKDPKKADPSLATSWEMSEDGLEYTFELRQGVTFEDGSPFNASVVKFSFERLMGVGAGPASPFEALDHVEVVDTYTVKFVLKRPFAPFLWTLASNFARIVPPSVMKHEVEGDWGQAWLSDHSIGSGPFRIESFLRGERVVLVRNENYWGTPPKLEKLIVRIIPEASTLRMELEAGTIDMAEGIIIEDIEKLKENPDIEVFETLGIGTTFLFFNTQKPPFDDRRVRLAIAHALDYDDIIAGPMKGYAQQVQGPIPEG